MKWGKLVKHNMAKVSAYSQVTRQMLMDFKETMDNNMKEINQKLNTVERKIVEATNHLSNRIPVWANTLLFILIGACGFLLKTILTK